MTEPRFRTVSVQVVNTVPTTESWGQVFAANTAKREISNDGSGQQTNIIHQTNGNYADPLNQPFIHGDVAAAGIATQVFTGVYQDDADITSPLIVDFDPTFSTGDNILEKVEVADYVAGLEIMGAKLPDMSATQLMVLPLLLLPLMITLGLETNTTMLK